MTAATKDLVSGGTGINLRLPVGEVAADIGFSRAAGTLAHAEQVSYFHASGSASVGASMKRSPAGYRTVNASLEPRASTELSMFGSVSPGLRTSMTLQHGVAIGAAAGSQHTSMLSSTRLRGGADLVATVTRTITRASRSMELSVGVTMTFGGSTVTSASLARGADGVHQTFDVQRSLPAGNGVGYRVRTESGTRRTLGGAVQLQGDHGRYEVRHDATDGMQHSAISASGALAVIGGGVHATRPITNSFALVRVPGVEGVRAYASNQEVGRTRRDGHLLVTDLLPYYGNQLNISDADVPLDFEVAQVQMIVAPPYRGGAVVQFPVKRIRRAIGTVSFGPEGHPEGTAFGDLVLTVDGEEIVSPIGGDGRFYFENLPPGPHRARLVRGERSCTVRIDMPEVDGSMVDLGALWCTE